MGNGVIDVVINGKETRLRFNVQAGLLFQSLMAKQTAKAGSDESNIILLGDLFYCGLYGDAVRSGKPSPSRESAIDLFDVFATSDTFTSDTIEMWKVWGESTIGNQMITLADKKKDLSKLKSKPQNK
jgi:hypothetical protein